MQAGNINVKIVTRKLQGSKAAFQFMLLAGFTPAITHTNADYVETLSPATSLTEDEIIGVIAKLVKWSNAEGYTDITNPSVQKKLEKLWEVPEGIREDGVTFAGMGIGNYL